MSLPANHADGPTTFEVVHIAGNVSAHRPRQRCARCSAVLVDQGKPHAPGESVVAYENTTWRTARAATCQPPPLRAHNTNGGR